MPFLSNEALIGKTILFGLTYKNRQDEIKGQIQVFGEIKSVQADGNTLEVTASDGETWNFPLYWRSMMLAPRGVYTLTSTGDTLRDPDLIASWTVIVDDSAENSPQTGEWSPNYAPFHNYQVPTEWNLIPDPDSIYERELIEDYGDAYLGKSLLLGVSHYQADENGGLSFTSQEQMFGTITRMSYKEGIILALSTGGEHRLPPVLTQIEPAGPGEYTLRATGEKVTDPDYISVWTVTHPFKK